MAGDQPFAPLQASTVGLGLTIAVSITNQGTITVTAPAIATNVLATNGTSVTLFVRLSKESAPVATSLDVAMAPNESRVFQNPVPQGTLGIGVYGSALIAFPGGGGVVGFTPGNSGVE